MNKELMKNELQVIDERELLGKQFRIYGTVENPLFLAKDVASWIEHSNPRMMLKSIDEEEKQCVNNPYALKGQQEQWFLTEDGLYEVLMQSRKPIAKQFKKEVKIILKTIRKHGAYMTEATLEEALTSPDFLIQLATKLKEEQEARKIAEEKNVALMLENQEQEAKLATQAPKVELYEDFMAKDNLYSVNDIAKCLAIKGMGRNNLYKFLRWNKILMDDYEAYQRFINEGKIVHRSVTYTCKGKEYTDIKAYFTAKGVEYLYKKLKKEGHISKKTVKQVLEELDSLEDKNN